MISELSHQSCSIPYGASIKKRALKFLFLSLLLLFSFQAFSLSSRASGVLSSLPPNTWVKVGQGISPPPLAGQEMVYDPSSNLFYMFGGQGLYLTLNEMWTFNPETLTWSQLIPSGKVPPPRADQVFVCVCDGELNESMIFMFGGWFNNSQGQVGRYSDTWIYFLGNRTWTELRASVAPPARSDAAAAYDPDQNVVLMYGGYNGSYFSDLWLFNISSLTWQILSIHGEKPPPLADARMRYDTSDKVFVLFGGNNDLNRDEPYNHYNDTWAFYLFNMSWRNMHPLNPPESRDYSHFTYDPSLNLFIMEGGYGDGIALSDTWLYSYTTNTWVQLKSAKVLPPRFAGSTAFNTKDGIMLLYGGTFNDTAYSDTLVMRLSVRGNITIETSPQNPTVRREIQFTTNITGDPAPIASYLWDFGDGYNSTSATPYHAYNSSGIKIVSLEARDALGQLLSVQTSVDVIGQGSFILLLMVPVVAIASFTGALAIILSSSFKIGKKKVTS